MSETLPRVLLPKEGDSALCLKASGSNSFAGLYRSTTKADDHWATRQKQLTPPLTRFHGALCRQSQHEELIPSRTLVCEQRLCPIRGFSLPWSRSDPQ